MRERSREREKERDLYVRSSFDMLLLLLKIMVLWVLGRMRLQKLKKSAA